MLDNFADLETENDIEYLYDDNGNMYSDANKGLENITYNHLNLPELVMFDQDNYILFTYDALGNNLEKQIVQNGQQKIIYTFAGSFVYENDELKQMATETGFVDITETTYKYEYFLKDHLGSIRVMFAEGSDGNAEILQENHYYPYGMRIAGLSFAGNVNNQLFSGKKLNNESFNGIALDWYDFHARNYDPQLGMWFNPDPMMEKYQSFTQYNYCFNDPVNFNDPNGMDAEPYIPEKPIWWSDGMPRWGSVSSYMMVGYSFADAGVLAHSYGNAFSDLSKQYSFMTTQEMVNYVSGLADNGAAKVNFVTGETIIFNYDSWLVENQTANLDVMSMNLIAVLVNTGIVTEKQAFEALYYKAQSSGIPMTAQDGVSGSTTGAITQAKYFSNFSDAYRYMWKNSFNSEGHPIVEVAAYIIDNGGLTGVLVLPNYNNTISTSRYDYLTLWGKERVGFYTQNTFGGKSRIFGTIHTHPSYNMGNIRISDADMNTKTFFNVPMQVIWNDTVYQIYSKYNWNNPVTNVSW